MVRRFRPWIDLVRVAHNARRRPRHAASAPLVSVIIATYNWSSALRLAIGSALEQTYPAIEVLVIGDACTDDSEAVVASFGDPRVRWHNLGENSGSQSIPNQTGLRLAHGEYAAYLGHDDLWLPTHISHLMEGVTHTGAKVAMARISWVGPDGVYRNTGMSAPSALLHETTLGRETGWRDYRELHEAPDVEFIARARERAGGMLDVPALTVFKFPSAWRKNSYVEKPTHDQQAYLDRIARERLFTYREVLAIERSRRRGDKLPVEFPEPPGPLPPGWHVTQYRKMRGLE